MKLDHDVIEFSQSNLFLGAVGCLMFAVFAGFMYLQGIGLPIVVAPTGLFFAGCFVILIWRVNHLPPYYLKLTTDGIRFFDMDQEIAWNDVDEVIEKKIPVRHGIKQKVIGVYYTDEFVECTGTLGLLNNRMVAAGVTNKSHDELLELLQGYHAKFSGREPSRDHDPEIRGMVMMDPAV